MVLKLSWAMSIPSIVFENDVKMYGTQAANDTDLYDRAV